MKPKQLHPLTHNLLFMNPQARWHARDRWKWLFFVALAVLALDIVFLLRLEAEYREDAKIRAVQTPYGATVMGERNGHPILEL